MTHLTDSNGSPLGGRGTLSVEALAHPAAATPGAAVPRQTSLNPNFGLDETVPSLECSYGSFAYSYAAAPSSAAPSSAAPSSAALPDDALQSRQHSRHPICHNPVEAPDERHHCPLCGGDYCDRHADPQAHDCEFVLRPA